MNAVATTIKHTVPTRLIVAAAVAVAAVVALIVTLLMVTGGSSTHGSPIPGPVPALSHLGGGTVLTDNSTCRHVLRGAC